MLQNGFPKEAEEFSSELEKNLEFIRRAEILSPNGRVKNSLEYNKNLQSYILYYSINKTNYKISLIVNGKPNPKYEKQLKKYLKI